MDGELTKLFIDAFDFIFFVLPILVPIVLIFVGFNIFLSYKRKKYLNSLEWVLLEIIPPADVMKSPVAMEIFLLSLHQTSGEGDWHTVYFEGKFRSFFSLELISSGGYIRYFIRAEKKYKRDIEANLYAQFPGIEIIEEKEDYTDGFYWDPDKFEMFACELELVKPDPYPIKTYVDYRLDMEQEQEFKVDPMAPVLEFLNTIKPNNHVWFQIIIRAHKKEDLDTKKTFPFFSEKIDLWSKQGKEEIKKIRMESFFEIEEGSGEKAIKKKSNLQTPGQKNLIGAIERSLSKYPFDTGIRLVAIAPKEDYDKSNKGIMGIWKQYSSMELNGFKPGYKTDFDWWYQDPFGNKLNRIKKEILDAYKERNYFWKDDYRGNPRKKMILNTEELATIYHFLGKSSEAPSVSKVEARKAAPPNNLPI